MGSFLYIFILFVDVFVFQVRHGLDHLSGSLELAGLLAVLLGGGDTRTLLRIGVIRHELAETDRKLDIYESASRLLRAAHGLLVFVETFNDRRALLRVHALNRARTTGVVSVSNDHGVVLFNSCDTHDSSP